MSKANSVAIVGGGPAGMVLAYLLAKQGINVTLLELHNDFDRDFRGDTVHASTLELFEQLGLVDEVLNLPHEKITTVAINGKDGPVISVSFDQVRSKYKFMAMMPQSNLLDFLRSKCEAFTNFTCLMGAAAQQLLEQDGHIKGLVYKQKERSYELRADLVVAADGRFSRLRKLAKLPAESASPPMDVVWFRLPKSDTDPASTAGFFVHSGTFLILISRQREWQIGYVFAKGDFASVKEQGLNAFRTNMVKVAPFLADRVELIREWQQVHLLNIKSDCLATWWKPGLLFIGDAAHVMSPVGGVGINCAIGDAVATANLLALPLRDGNFNHELLYRVQAQRQGVIQRVQNFQSIIQNRIVKLAVNNKEFQLPMFAKIILNTPFLKDIPPNMFAKGPAAVKLDNSLI